jgi:hypothetical protein
VSPILGIIASSKLTAAAGDYESIATVTVGSGGQATISFTSIPSTYEHLQIRVLGRSAFVDDTDNLSLKLNGSSSASGWHILRGNGSAASALGYTIYLPAAPYFPAANQSSSIFGASVIDILDYKNTNKYKVWRALGGADHNGSGNITLTSGLYQSTSAITSIDLSFNNGNAAQYSHFALYGCKSA